MTQRITLQPLSFQDLSDSMKAAKADSPVVKYYVGGQCWKWEGGESQTIVVDRTPWHLIQYRGETRTVSYPGIRQALEAEFGVEVEVP